MIGSGWIADYPDSDLARAVEELSELIEAPIEPESIMALRQKVTDKTVSSIPLHVYCLVFNVSCAGLCAEAERDHARGHCQGLPRRTVVVERYRRRLRLNFHCFPIAHAPRTPKRSCPCSSDLRATLAIPPTSPPPSCFSSSSTPRSVYHPHHHHHRTSRYRFSPRRTRNVSQSCHHPTSPHPTLLCGLPLPLRRTM